MPEAGNPTGDASPNLKNWDRVKSLFFRALQVPGADRIEWVRRNSGGDNSLCDEVTRLLADHEAAGDFLEYTPVVREQSVAINDVLAGRFRIRKLIGKGGMGEVYEAEDLASLTTLALKTISAEVARDKKLTSRLRNELLLARNISHPNVCKVYEYWETDYDGGRVVFFTMELLQGDTLASRIVSQGKIPPDAALAILKQLAAGLEEVHRLGIIHRDLKPSNVLLVPAQSGERAVLMDFGLARTVARMDQDRTKTNLVMGTPPYMAPEMFEGGEIEPAADIFSFGVLAMEMVTGSNAPLVSPRSVNPSLGPAWDQLLRCFERDPSKRPATAWDVLGLIEGARRRRRAIVIGAGLALAGALAATAWLRTGVVVGRPPAITQLTFDEGFTADPAASADGKLLVYASDRGTQGNLNIWLQKVDSTETRQLTSDNHDQDEPAISPDGTQFVYRSVGDKALYLAGVDGRPRRLIAKYGEAPRFSPDGSKIVYWTGVEGERTSPTGQIWVVPTAGGEPRRLAADFVDARSPTWAPDGKLILFRGVRNPTPSMDANFDWWITDAQTNRATPSGAGSKLRASGLMPHDSPIAWDGSHIIFSARTGHSFNLWRMRLSSLMKTALGGPQPITTSSGFPSVPAILSGGRIAYALWREQVNVWSFDANDQQLRQETFHEATDTRVSVTRDGKTMVFGRRLGETRDVWIKDLAGGVERRVETNELAVPFISPNGKTIALSIGTSIRLLDVATSRQISLCSACGELLGWLPDESAVLYLKDLTDGSEAITRLDILTRAERVLVSGRGLHEAAVSPSGSLIAFSQRTNGVNSRLFLARLDGQTSADTWVPLSEEDAWSDKPVWSEDGRVLYYKSDRDGFQCIWSRQVNPATALPEGEARPIKHLHKITFSLSHLNPSALSLAQAGGRLFLNIDSSTSNIWSIRP